MGEHDVLLLKIRGLCFPLNRSKNGGGFTGAQREYQASQAKWRSLIVEDRTKPSGVEPCAILFDSSIVLGAGHGGGGSGKSRVAVLCRRPDIACRSMEALRGA